jgi:DNA-binding beta-propeller fold protein YncE
MARAARFNFPGGVATDDSGNVYVADTENHILRKITAAGAVTTIAGSASVIGAIAGRLPGSLLLPQAIALTPSGDAIVTSSQGVVQITAF